MNQQPQQQINVVIKKEGCLSGCLKWCGLFFLGLVILGVFISSTFKNTEEDIAVVQAEQKASQRLQINYKERTEEILKTRLAYLSTEVQELAWYAVQGNEVYIAFKMNRLPGDYKLIAKGAAVAGSTALKEAKENPTRCTIWVVSVNDKPGLDTPSYYTVTARHGVVER